MSLLTELDSFTLPFLQICQSYGLRRIRVLRAKTHKNRVFGRTNRIMAARIDFCRTDGKLARTERPIARTDQIIAARTGKWPHETIFVRTEGEIVRTD